MSSYKDFVYYDAEQSAFILKTGWALAYILAQKPIPKAFRNEFYDELVREDDDYRKALEEATRQFGVRWI